MSIASFTYKSIQQNSKTECFLDSTARWLHIMILQLLQEGHVGVIGHFTSADSEEEEDMWVLTSGTHKVAARL
jgi:hypothetical protein